MTNPKIQSLNFLNKIQDHSVENGKQIYKQLCKRCGGKGYYQDIVVVSGIKIKDEIVSCLECEAGFIYGPKSVE